MSDPVRIHDSSKAMPALRYTSRYLLSLTRFFVLASPLAFGVLFGPILFIQMLDLWQRNNPAFLVLGFFLVTPFVFVAPANVRTLRQMFRLYRIATDPAANLPEESFDRRVIEGFRLDRRIAAYNRWCDSFSGYLEDRRRGVRAPTLDEPEILAKMELERTRLLQAYNDFAAHTRSAILMEIVGGTTVRVSEAEEPQTVAGTAALLETSDVLPVPSAATIEAEQEGLEGHARRSSR